MFGNPVSSGLTFSKVLGGLSKTLSIANQVIPLYREAKPMIHNAKTIFSVLKDINKNNNSSRNNTSNNITSSKSNSSFQNHNVSIPIAKQNQPVFFL